MAVIVTSKGLLEYTSHLLYFGDHKVQEDVMMDDLRVLSIYFDKIDINWGPAFGTLIGIVRDDALLPWAKVFDIYILREDEERFKDVLWLLRDVGFELVRYERRGLYYLRRNGETFKIFVMRKISADVRHTGGSDFIHEKYLQNTIKWRFWDIELNVPENVDEYLSFQYGDWTVPTQTTFYKFSPIKKWFHWGKMALLDHLPDLLYYRIALCRRMNDFNRFKFLCEKKQCPLPKNVELSSMKPRKHKKVLTVGVYDLLHGGHVELFRRAKGLGDYLIVAVQDGDLILKYKPLAKVLNSTEDRVHLVKSIRYVDETIVYGAVDDVVKKIEFDVFVTGPDQCHSGFQNAIRWCEEHGKEHIVLARTEGVSSSELKNKIAQSKSSV